MEDKVSWDTLITIQYICNTIWLSSLLANVSKT